MSAPGFRPASSGTGPAGTMRLLKRVFDLGLVLMAFPVVAPAFLIIAFLVRLSGPGPVILRLSCVGRNGQSFGQYRFRIIHLDAEERMRRHQGPASGEGARDPRVTAIGHWLVRSGLNRLPQLLNVLLGDMSVVGPRPLTIAQQAHCSDYERRLMSVRPGIFTPESLVPDQRSRSETDRRALDLAYVANPALSTDTRILMAAFARMIGLRSA